MMKCVYTVAKLVTRPRRKVVLISRLYSTTSLDFRLLQRKFQSLRPAYAVVILNHRRRSAFLLPFQLLNEICHLATSQICIIDSYIIPVSVLHHRKQLTVVQIWHALGAVKRFGKASLDRPEGHPSRQAHILHMHEGYNWVTTSGEPLIPVMAEAFGVPESTVLPIGSPKIDFLASPDARAICRNKVANKYPALHDKPTILYAPTFRKENQFSYDLLVAAIDTSKYNLVIKLHPLDVRPSPSQGVTIDDSDLTTLEWMFCADYVITDYSAVVFEAAVVNVPIFLYRFDDADYRARRGVFESVDAALPGVRSTDPTVIADAIAHNDTDTEALQAFRTAFIKYTDGSCTDRIVNVVTKGHEL